VFTYSLLDAIGQADANGDGFVDVTELASYVDQRVQQLSLEAFKVAQVPQMKIVGSNFPVVTKLGVLTGVPVAAPRPAVSRPTHVVIAPTTVRQLANATAATVMQLSPGQQVILVESAGGWVLVARDGKNLGYVEAKALLKLE
jgi:hypothetical protein